MQLSFLNCWVYFSKLACVVEVESAAAAVYNLMTVKLALKVSKQLKF